MPSLARIPGRPGIGPRRPYKTMSSMRSMPSGDRRDSGPRVPIRWHLRTAHDIIMPCGVGRSDVRTHGGGFPQDDCRGGRLRPRRGGVCYERRTNNQRTDSNHGTSAPVATSDHRPAAVARCPCRRPPRRGTSACTTTSKASANRATRSITATGPPKGSTTTTRSGTSSHACPAGPTPRPFRPWTART